MVVGLALVIAGIVDHGAAVGAEARAAGRSGTPAAWTALAASAFVGLSALAGTPLLRDHPSLAQASRAQTEELAALEARLGALAPGARRERVRVRKQFGSRDRVVDHAWMLSPWGLQAWLELVFPDRRFEVELDTLRRPERTHWNLVVVEQAPPTGG
jgi:hypothetical protein